MSKYCDEEVGCGAVQVVAAAAALTPENKVPPTSTSEQNCTDESTTGTTAGKEIENTEKEELPLKQQPNTCDSNNNENEIVMGVQTAAVAAAAENSTSEIDPSTAVIATSESQQLSKNQVKKRRRMEKAIEIKQRKKQQKKQVRYERAKAQGRDIDHERIQQEQARLQSATNQNRINRIQEWQHNMMPKIQTSYQICIDCSYESYMTAKEINSLALQIRYCYSSNKRSNHPCQLTATSIGCGSSCGDTTNSDTTNATNNNNNETLNHLRKVNGFDEWSNYGFVKTADSFDQYFSKNIQNVIYLTSDSENTIATLEDDKIYVIGGIVDRNRYRQLTYNRATALGIATAKLPIDTYLSAMPSTRVLTTNHVFDLLIKYKQYNRCWKKALEDVLPIRKDAIFVEEVAVDEE